MAKRAASNQLTHDNWDEEEESEDPGTYRTLSAEELKHRVIKKARRSLPSKKEPDAGSSPFAAFSGFKKSSDNPNPFSFVQKPSSDAVTGVKEEKENGNSESNRSEGTELPQTNVSQSSDTTKPKRTRSIEYYRRLQSLNESIMKWMELHIAKNACCDFTPVFNDYKKHIDTLNVTYPVKTNSATESNETPASSFFSSSIGQKRKYEENNSNDSKKSLDGTDYGNNFSSNTTNTSTFSFGPMNSPSATSSLMSGPTSSSKEGFAPPDKKPAQFSFGLKSSDDASKPFSFASAPVEKAAEADNVEDEGEYVPPKNDSAPVEEKDAFYSKKCKLFFKKGESFVEKGVGFLYLKPLDGKTQLLVRADTTLGNILLNIILSDSIPMSRTGKNNVLLVCVPNPPLNPGEDSKTAIPMLIRVKTSEDADELLQTLDKHKS